MEMVLWGFVLALVLSLILAIVRVFLRSRTSLAGDAIYLVLPGVHRCSSSCSCSITAAAALPHLRGDGCLYRRHHRPDPALRRHSMAESIRAAILGIHKSQMEAALSIGMSRLQAMQRIILPQAARIATPSLMNHFIDMIKSTSLAFTWVWRRSWARPRWKRPPPSSSSELHGSGADLLSGGHLLHPLAASTGSAAESCLLKEACLLDQTNGSLRPMTEIQVLNGIDLEVKRL